ncbi:protein translocase subunit SecD [Stenotrophobium rhamnosiphilum]|uniref:Protein translocase subunit SecD n=1 Tax=Stenotrophobium rhamnosiphilum TaxID=2029166 RepID=A0A2T5MIG0_9GAMM|nr:protein translocase subunit SecD [Stenotrophobium rhamnosiphilum]PTU32383.1 protein translocase subunit SecD [Stenotrophobium rhamnosiphilum]
MQPYATWKYVLLIVVMVLGGLYAAPNLYGEDPAVQIATQSGDALANDFGDVVGKTITEAGAKAKLSVLKNQQWLVSFEDEAAQRLAADALKRAMGNDYVVALTTASKTPEWLRAIGAKPMTLGLDLRGGVHFLLEVDIDDVRKKAVERYLTELPAFLRKNDIRYTGRHQSADAVLLDFADADKLSAAKSALAKEYSELMLTVLPSAPLTLEVKMSVVEAKRIVDFAVKQNLTTLRNRVNQLGVAEPLVQRQGQNRIVVELPGVTDATQVESLLGATATLEYRAVDESDANLAASSGLVPADSELFYTRAGHRPILLKRDIIAAGSQLVDAASTVDENGSPAVSVTLDGSGAKKMFEFTEKNVGKPMAVLFKEREVVTNYNAKGEPMREHRDVQEIISIATIRGVFGKRFQTTGLESKEAHDLAILLRAGALAAPVDIVEVRTVGPSLGADNIRRGFQAAVLGLVLVMLFMVFYYRVFGAFAIAALVLNIVLIIAGMSIMSATLTMPGIAAMVLTMGIAVDANVLIYERIREELRDGQTPHASIEAGYDRAFLTIADANVTVLIGTLVLFAMGAGPIKGFAITLALGILTSQFTSIVGSRSLAHLVFAKRKLKDLPIW